MVEEFGVGLESGIYFHYNSNFIIKYKYICLEPFNFSLESNEEKDIKISMINTLLLFAYFPLIF